MKNLNQVKTLMILSVLFLALLFFPTKTFAAKKMTVYKNVIKDGNTVYCNDQAAIYKVDIKKKKVKRLTIVKTPDDEYLGSMKKKGSYLYYTHGGPVWIYLCRINLSNGKKQIIVKKIENKKRGETCVGEYVISGSKIYYNVSYANEPDGKIHYKVMKLNGKNKRKTSVKAKTSEKDTNAKGYSIFTKGKGDNEYSYLKMPKKTLYLGKFNWYEN